MHLISLYAGWIGSAEVTAKKTTRAMKKIRRLIMLYSNVFVCEVQSS